MNIMVDSPRGDATDWNAQKTGGGRIHVQPSSDVLDLQGFPLRNPELFNFLDSPPHGEGGQGTWDDPMNLDADVPMADLPSTGVVGWISDRLPAFLAGFVVGGSVAWYLTWRAALKAK